MLTVTNDKFTVNNYKEIMYYYNLMVDTVRQFLKKDKILLSNNYKTYEKLLKQLSDLNIKDKLSLEDLIDFYMFTNYFVANYNKIIAKIRKLVVKGYLQDFELETDKILYIQLLLPSNNDYVNALQNTNIKPKIIKKLLLEKKCYDLIILLKYEDLSSALRQQLAIDNIRPNNYFILYNIQRHGLYPVGNYEKLKPEKGATIINLESHNPIVFNIGNLTKQYGKYEGVSEEYINNVVQPIQLQTEKQDSLKPFDAKSSEHVYETFDNVFFRKLIGDPNSFLNGPSKIAYGYNTQFNELLYKYKSEPYINSVVLSFVKQKHLLKYGLLTRKFIQIYNTKKDEKDYSEDGLKELFLAIIEGFLKDNLTYVNIHKTVQHEINLGIKIELIRLKKQLAKNTIIEFIEFIKIDKSNIITLIDQKKRVFEKYN